MEMKPQASSGWGPFFRLIRQTRLSKWMLATALGLSLVTTVSGLFVPLLTKNLVNHFSLASLNPWHIGALVLAFVVQAAAGGFSTYLLNRVGQDMVAHLRERLWKKLLRLPVSYYDEHQTGETISRMTNDTGVIKSLISDHLSNFINGLIAIVGAISILLILDWQMTVVMLTAVPVTLLIMMPLGRQMHKIAKSMQDETAHFSADLAHVLLEIRLVKASNAERIEYQNGKSRISNLFRFGVREGKVQALIAPLMGLVMTLLLVVILGYGGMRVSSGALTAGDLVAFIMYLFQIVMPVGQLTAFFAQLQKTIGATERIVDTLALDEEDPDSGLELEDAHQVISVEDLTFGYNPEEPVLKGIRFTMEPGKVTAIVGPSGSGKTTFFALIERFYQPQGGSIKLGGVPISQFSLSSWRKYIGYVSHYEGHVLSVPKPETLTPDNIARDFLAIADAVEADRFAYYGYSWLALSGLQLAIRTNRLTALIMGGYPPIGGPYQEMLRVTMATHEMAISNQGTAKEKRSSEIDDWSDSEVTMTREQTKQFVTLYQSLQDFDDKEAPRLCFAGSRDKIEYGERWGNVHVDIVGPLIHHDEELKEAGWDVQILEGLDHTGAMQAHNVLPILRPWLDAKLFINR